MDAYRTTWTSAILKLVRLYHRSSLAIPSFDATNVDHFNSSTYLTSSFTAFADNLLINSVMDLWLDILPLYEDE